MKTFLILLMVGILQAAVICSAGKVQPSPVTQLMITCISDSQYQYYHIEKPDAALFAKIGRSVVFCGKLRVEILNIEGREVRRCFIKLKDYQF